MRESAVAKLTCGILLPLVCMSLKFSLGVDYGTSGLRICLINSYEKDQIVYESALRWKSDEITSSNSWISSLQTLISGVPTDYKTNIAYICISGTSSTALLYDIREEREYASPRLYNYNIFDDPQGASYGKKPWEIISQYAPRNSPVVAPTSTLMKLLSWHAERTLDARRHRLMHQSDFVANYLINQLHGEIFYSDWHNALKLGYDVEILRYPDWLLTLIESQGLTADVLPVVIQPGKTMGIIDPTVAERLNLSSSCQIIAGTTDSIAAFLASGVNTTGEAVTSLGSTLAIKSLSAKRIEDSSLGIYSHRLGNEWLVGGASNVGCQIFRKENFSDEELIQLSSQMRLNDVPFARYYPLNKVGERFPVNDPNKLPILDPKPENRKDYLYALLYSIAQIESDAYTKLESLGASKITKIYTAGGGSRNPFWSSLRSQILQRAVANAKNTEASYGAALLGCNYSE